MAQSSDLTGPLMGLKYKHRGQHSPPSKRMHLKGNQVATFDLGS